MTQCFWCEPTDRAAISLRRYQKRDYSEPLVQSCPGPMQIHDASVLVGDAPVTESAREGGGTTWSVPGHDLDAYRDDPRWPTKCAHCEYVFTDDDERQVFRDRLYRRTDTGEEIGHRTMDHTPGAMWDATYYPWKGPDGRSLMAVCPDGHAWNIDGRASNCTLPDDTSHRCWLRTGDVPNVTVSKEGPPGWTTCAAGAGSIGTPGYHGFLQKGRFT